MIEPGELHRYFAVRNVATGAEVRILGGDTRYSAESPDLRWRYRIDAAGDYFLAAPLVPSHPLGRVMRLDEVEPFPDGQGRYGALDEFQLARTYEGSFRQVADLAAEHVDDMAERHDYERFGDPEAEPEWATAGYDPAAR